MRIDLKIPATFSELKSDQLMFVCKLIAKNTEANELKMLCLLKFTGLKLLTSKQKDAADGKYWFKYHGDMFMLSNDLVTDIISRLDYLTQTPCLFHPPAKIKRFTSCDSRLFGVRLDKWLFADLMYTDFNKTQDIDSLNKLLAVFYCSESDQWDDGSHIDRWARRFKRVPLPVKYAVFLWYTSVKAWLIDKYYYVFNGSSGGEETSADEIIMSILSNLNDGKVADNNIIKASEMHEALFEMNRKIEYIKNLKK